MSDKPLAEAWERGYLDAVNDVFRDRELRKQGDELKDPTPNPYRAP